MNLAVTDKMSEIPIKYYPTVYLDGDNAELFEDIGVGDTINVVAKMHLKSKTEREGMYGKSYDVSIEIKEMTLISSKGYSETVKSFGEE